MFRRMFNLAKRRSVSNYECRWGKVEYFGAYGGAIVGGVSGACAMNRTFAGLELPIEISGVLSMTSISLGSLIGSVVAVCLTFTEIQAIVFSSACCCAFKQYSQRKNNQDKI